MIEIGRILKCFRKEKQLAMKQVCTGICSVAMLSHYESGKNMQSVVLFEYFMRRVGNCFEEFAIMVTEEEYGYFLWKEEIFQAIEEKQWKKVRELLESKEAITEVMDICEKKFVGSFMLIFMEY